MCLTLLWIYLHLQKIKTKIQTQNLNVTQTCSTFSLWHWTINMYSFVSFDTFCPIQQLNIYVYIYMCIYMERERELGFSCFLARLTVKHSFVQYILLSRGQTIPWHIYVLFKTREGGWDHPSWSYPCLATYWPISHIVLGMSLIM